MSPLDKDLDKTLAGRSAPDQDTAPLVDVARRLEGMLDADVPEARRERALFATAVATRRRPTLWRYLGPAVAVTSLLVAVYFAGRAATPGNAFYPVRKALQQVDLAPRVSENVQDRLARVRLLLQEAGQALEDSPLRAGQLATEGLKLLGAVEEQIADLPADQRPGPQKAADELEAEAVALLALSVDEEEPEAVDAIEDRLDDAADRREEKREDAEDARDDSDNSGSDSDDSGSDSDNSGSGGSGSGSGSDDNSGSGSGND